MPDVFKKPKKKDFTNVLRWRVTYDDDTVVWEIAPSGGESKIGDVDFKRIKYFDLIKPPTKPEDFLNYEVEFPIKSKRGEPVMARFQLLHREVQPIFRLHLQKGQRLIFARRSKMNEGQRVMLFGAKDVQVAIPPPPSSKTILVGWQKTENGVNTQAIVYIHPDGSIELAGQFGSDADHLEVETVEDKAKKNT